MTTPPIHFDADGSRRYYTLGDAMRLSPAEYLRWVYDPKTAKADEVRLYESKRRNAVLNNWPVWLPHVVWLPVIIALFASSTHPAWALAGFAVWPLVELGFHRFVFHMPVNNRVQQRLHVILHGSHHLAPNAEGRLASHPLLVTVYSLSFYWLAQALGINDPQAFVAGMLIGYLRTDSTHAAVHLFSIRQLARVPLLGHFLVTCKRNHMAHHFVDAHDHFAISFYLPNRPFFGRQSLPADAR